MPKPVIKLVVAAALASCAASEPAHGSGSTSAFICEGGYYFWVEYLDGAARVTTSGGTFVLAERPSSIGRKFSSDSAAFIHDEDRGALNGLPGGPFRRCREAGRGSANQLPPLPETLEIENITSDDNFLLPGADDEAT